MINPEFIRYHLFALTTSRAFAHLRASCETFAAAVLFLLDTLRRLQAEVPAYYRKELQDADDEHWAAREMYAGAPPETLARRASTLPEGEVDQARYEFLLGCARGVAGRYGLS